MEQMPMARKINTGVDRVIILQKDAKYIIRIKNDMVLSDEETDRLINAFGRVISGEASMALIEFDFELIQIVNE